MRINGDDKWSHPLAVFYVFHLYLLCLATKAKPTINLYGVDIYVSSNAPVLETAAQNSIAVRGCLFFHQDALVMAEQMAVRSQTQYKQEYLSTLYTADTLYGVEVYRPEAGFILAVCDE